MEVIRLIEFVFIKYLPIKITCTFLEFNSPRFILWFFLSLCIPGKKYLVSLVEATHKLNFLVLVEPKKKSATSKR